jgi:capsule polysaccharide export protein KpsE/RkpR
MELKINIEELKRDIAEQEEMALKCLKEANNIFYFAVICVIMFIYSLIIANLVVASAFFVVGFLSVRRYNKLVGMIEVHNAIQSFLRMLLIQEQTGEDVFKNIVA